MRRCLGCMKEYDEKYDVCPYCGYCYDEDPIPTCMSPGTILRGENSNYTIGKVIGRGSFGVTYIAWDNVLERKVAVKEYMPNGCATRGIGETTVSIVKSNYTQFSQGIEKFIDEARKLAKFQEEDGIVKIYDHFYENETAYIVMEYLDGVTLSRYLEENGTFESHKAVELLMPILRSLVKVHEAGIIHRDIAPDNIMITKDGKAKLIDFGAARYVSVTGSKSLSVLVKLGYSPIEQCTSDGKQGTYTDVYALSATLYKMITGITPPQSIDRKTAFEHRKHRKKGNKNETNKKLSKETKKETLQKGKLLPISKKVKNVPENIQVAIYNGLNILVEDRTENVQILIDELISEKPVKPRANTIKVVDTFAWPLWVKIAVGAAASVVVVLIALLAAGVIHFVNPLKKDISVPDGMTRVPALINQELAEGEEMLDAAKLLYTISGKEYSSVIPKDYILSQSVNPGYLTAANTMISIKVSGGAELVELPDIVGLEKQEGIDILEKLGLGVKIVETYNYYITEGYIIAQETESGEEIAVGSEIEIKVSMGKDPDGNIEEKTVVVPDFIGMSYENAVKLAIDSELPIHVEKKTYTDKYEKNIVMGQNLQAGTEISNNQSVALEVSLGVKYVNVPDVQFLTETEAESRLTQNELKVSKRYEESETIAAGLVISQNVKNGEKVLPETVVEIVISKGRGSFDMINVIGEQEKKAVADLRNKGLQVTVSYTHSDTAASGTVISQSVQPGAKITGGSAVSIVVSSGEELFTVPEVVGMEQNKAQNDLEAQRFKVIVNSVYSDTVQNGCVISQTLTAGGQYRKGTAIAIEVSKGKQPFMLSFNGNGGNTSEENRTIHYGDSYGSLPSASKTGYTLAGWYTTASGGKAVTSSSTYGVRSNQTLYAHWTANKYTVYFNGNGGSSRGSITVTYDSVYGGLPSNSRENYSFDGWYTAANGGQKITDTTKVTITSNQTLYAHWTRGKLNVKFNANGGSVGTSSKEYNQGDKYSGLPTPTREYYTFDGWYTAASGGSKVTSSTTVTATGNQTLYAHWTLNPVSDWVLESNVPAGAQIMQTKWTYTKTETKETTNSSESGWAQTGSYWNKTGSGSVNYATFPYGYDTGNLYYQNFAKQAYGAYDNGNTKREVSNTWAGYIYWHWMYNCGNANGTPYRAIYNQRGTGPDTRFYYQYFYAFASSNGNYASDRTYCNSLMITNYIIPERTAYAECGGATRWFRFDYYTSSYTDYQKIYQYKKVTNGLESTTAISNGGQISNVKKYVKYRAK